MLTMAEYLRALDEHGLDAAHILAEKYHVKVVLAKAEKASRKGYADYGTSAAHSWIEPRGRAFLSSVEGERANLTN